MRNRRFAPWIALAVLLVGFALHPRAVRAQGGPALVMASPVVEREVASGQTFVGTVMPLKRAVVGSAVDGRVVEFPVNEGDRVMEGQKLAQLLIETISLETQAAEAELEIRKEELIELQNGSRPEEIDQARAIMLAAQARMELAQAKLRRAKSLYERGQTITDDQLEETVSTAAIAQQTFYEAKAALELAEQGPREERIKQAQARVVYQQAVVDKLKDQLKKHTMISRFDGYVVAEHTEIGQWVSRGDPVAEVVALDEVDIEAFVLESHVPHVRVGVEVRVEVPALPHELLTGTVALIVPQADVRSRTFPVKVRVKNAIVEGIPLLKAGMLARVTLPTGPRQKSLLVPKDALVLGGPTPIVYVVDRESANSKQGKSRAVPVELGVADGRLIQVKGDLKPGQLVVVQGNERLRPMQDVILSEQTAQQQPGR